ncbi:MAG: FAD-dependent oxidoreductase [Caulobacteraceae bacterium]
MSGLSNLRVTLAGAGALGLATAWTLAEAGARVTVIDPARVADNASGVAAGMLAPAFEAVLDPASADHFDLLMAARNAWQGFAAGLAARGAALDRSGAMWTGDEVSLEDVDTRLRAIGAEARRLTRAEAMALSPGLAAPAGAVFTPDDWRLDAPGMLGALHDAFLARGGAWRNASLVAAEAGQARLSDGGIIPADVVIIATGLAPAGLQDAPPELACLQPIKGQIVRLLGAAPASGPVVRASGVYVAPSAAGALVGATMEAGVDDRRVDPGVVARLQGLAASLFPAMAGAPAVGGGGRAGGDARRPAAGRSRAAGRALCWRWARAAMAGCWRR